MPRVYIPNSGSHDFSPAKRFGELVVVTSGILNPHAVGRMHRSWAAALEGSSPEDYIVITSLSSLCSVGAALFAAKYKKLNLLLFRDGTYKPFHQNMEEL